MKRYAILLLAAQCVLFVNKCYAQKINDGFVITNAGDTIRGNILTHSYLETTIKTSSGNYTYTYKDSKAFGFTNSQLFVSGISDSSFVEQLVEGGLSLYLFNDVFIIKKDQTTRTLTSNEGKIIDGKLVEKDRKWQGILGYFTNDCTNLKEPPARLLEKAMTKYTIAYNECRGSSYTETKSLDSFIKLIPYAAVGYSYNTTTGGAGRRNLNIDFPGNLNWNVGVLITNPRKFKRSFIGVELGYAKTILDMTYEVQVTNLEGQLLGVAEVEGGYDITSINIPLSYNYLLDGAKKTKLLIGFGPHFTFNRSTETFTRTFNERTRGWNEEPVNDFQVGIFARLMFLYEINGHQLGLASELTHQSQLTLGDFGGESIHKNSLTFKLVYVPKLGN